MIKKLFLFLFAINIYMPNIYAQDDCESMMQGGDRYVSKGQYEKAIKMYRQVQAKCGSNYAGVGKKIAICISAQKEYNDYNKCNTIEDCEYYLSAYPNGKYVSQVRNLWSQKSQLRVEEMISVCDSIWSQLYNYWDEVYTLRELLLAELQRQREYGFAIEENYDYERLALIYESINDFLRLFNVEVETPEIDYNEVEAVEAPAEE